MGAYDTGPKAKQVERLINNVESSSRQSGYVMGFTATVAFLTLVITLLIYLKS